MSADAIRQGRRDTVSTSSTANRDNRLAVGTTFASGFLVNRRLVAPDCEDRAMPRTWLEGRALSIDRQTGVRIATRRAAAIGAAIGIGAVGLSFAYHLTDQHIPGLLADRIGTADRLVVDKSERQLLVMSDDSVLAQYRVALGANPVGHKEIQGDSRTPEGTYTIDWHMPDSDFYRALHISYPNAQDRKFAAAIRRSSGGAIMIHGQPDDLGWLERLTRASDWTNGCIAVSNHEIEELWRAVPDGTPITIRP